MGLPWQELAPHLLTGLAVWNFFLGSTLQGCSSFFTNESYIRQCPLPMAIYPLRTVLANSFHFLMAFLVVVGVHTAVHPIHPKTIALNLIPVFALYFIFAWSLATVAGLINVYFQDTQHLLEVGFQILFYLTPILFPDKIVRERGLEWLTNLSPFTPFLRILREPLANGLTAPWEVWAQALGTAAVAATLAGLLMNRLSKKLIFHL
jgi:ABC-type polysaccharide/polyol phosphate export permease